MNANPYEAPRESCITQPGYDWRSMFFRSVRLTIISGAAISPLPLIVLPSLWRSVLFWIFCIPVLSGISMLPLGLLGTLAGGAGWLLLQRNDLTIRYDDPVMRLRLSTLLLIFIAAWLFTVTWLLLMPPDRALR